MSLIINIPDLDDTASQLAVLQETIGGFPVANLQALYLFEDGAVGSTPTQAVDSSGNGKTAALLAGAAPTRIAEGIKTSDALSAGFMFSSGVPFNASFSVVGVCRSRVPPSTANSFPLLHTTSAAYGSGGYLNTAANGVFAVNHDNAGASDAVSVGVLNRKTDATTAWTGASSSRIGSTAVSPRATWEAWAMAIDIATGAITLRANNSTVTFTALADLTTFLTQGGNHAFGSARYGSSLTALADIGLFGIYSGAKDVAGLDSLITSAKARMLLRGVTAA